MTHCTGHLKYYNKMHIYLYKNAIAEALQIPLQQILATVGWAVHPQKIQHSLNFQCMHRWPFLETGALQMSPSKDEVTLDEGGT